MRSSAGMARIVANALAMIGWPELPVSNSGAEWLYADSAERRLRISHSTRVAAGTQMRPARISAAAMIGVGMACYPGTP
jgi:hypothetical protein